MIRKMKILTYCQNNDICDIIDVVKVTKNNVLPVLVWVGGREGSNMFSATLDPIKGMYISFNHKKLAYPGEFVAKNSAGRVFLISKQDLKHKYTRIL